MQDALRSKMFDDVYFSADGGLEETRHVFLEGNSLPAAWQGRNSFVIAETGFGTGLNFLSAWKLFVETAPQGAFLDFISVEKFPLTPDVIRDALKPWADVLGPYTEKLCSCYPMRAAGFHRIVFDGRVALTLIFDDVKEALPQLSAQVDAWFLDGFTPAKNPEMWTSHVFTEMARLSALDATYATFTAASIVRKGLSDAGFTVEKRPGFGRKRDMLAGRFTGGRLKADTGHTKTVAVVGGWLAGASCAHVLSQYGFTPVVYEARGPDSAPPQMILENLAGLYNPRFSALRGPESDFYAAAYAQTVRTLRELNALPYNPCGTLHLVNTPEKEKRFMQTLENWGWRQEHMRLVCSEEASDAAGAALDSSALHLPDSGRINPFSLCAHYLKDTDVRMERTVTDLSELKEDAVILACGAGVKNFASLADLPVYTVRGQVTFAAANDESANLKTNICYGGYLSAPANGMHIAGSTFQKWLDHVNLLDADNESNLEKARENIPSITRNLKPAGAAAGLRTSSKDRFPIAGAVPGHPGLYVSTAHGSHGIVGTLAAAHLIADLLRAGPLSLPNHSASLLSPQRFADREARKRG